MDRANRKYPDPPWLSVAKRHMPAHLSFAGLAFIITGRYRHIPTSMRLMFDARAGVLARIADAIGVERGDFFVEVVQEMEQTRKKEVANDA